jgi:hypothetical protein
MLWPWRRRIDDPPIEFTGNCLVRQHTGDGYYVGRCWHSTYNGSCHLHGDVTEWLDGDFMRWPSDERLRAN